MRKTKRQAIEEANIALQNRALNESKLINEETVREYIEQYGLSVGKNGFESHVGDPINTPITMKLFAEYFKKGIDLGLQEELKDYQSNPEWYKD